MSFDAPSFFDCNKSAEFLAELYKGRMRHAMFDLAHKHAEGSTKIQAVSLKGEKSVIAVTKISKGGVTLVPLSSHIFVADRPPANAIEGDIVSTMDDKIKRGYIAPPKVDLAASKPMVVPYWFLGGSLVIPL